MRASGRRGTVAVEVIEMSSSIVTRAPHVPLPRRVRRHPQARIWRPWLVAWLGASVLGIVNGGVREVVYADRLGETAARHVSVATLIALLALYVAALDRRWPLPSRRIALRVGAAWAGVTVAFELGFGHWVAGDSWAELAGQYDVLAGRTWVLVLAWIAVAPAVLRALRVRSGGDA